ncbi:MAG: BspA family leucine-rich repeat surface protein [Clostridia bacterium]|nr:BspA family leucine-rich repeat surface protein [Clostridia bacterium]
MKCDIFISYRRDGGDMTAMYIYQSLKERGYNVFYDLEVLRAGQFNDELLNNIRMCKDFVLILSPHALDRCGDENDWVRKEIAEALRCKKNIIPVMLNGFTFPAQLPADIEAVRYQNGLSATTEYFVESINRMCKRYLDSKPKRKAAQVIVVLAVLLAALAVAAGFFLLSGGRHKPDMAPMPVSVPTAEPTAEPAAEPTPDQRTISQRNHDEAGISMPSGSDLPQMISVKLRQEYDDVELYRTDMAFGNPAYTREEIRTVTFLPAMTDMGENAWDLSVNQDQSVMAWAQKNGELYDLYIAGEGGLKFPADASSTFTGFTRLEAVNFNACVDFSEVTNMRAMFEQCISIKSIDLRGLDTSNVEDMCAVFMTCPNLETIEIAGMDTSSARNISGMFKGCVSLRYVDVSSFDTSHVLEMDEVFFQCESLTAVDVSGWDVGRVHNMREIFFGCKALQSLDLSTWKPKVVGNVQGAFADCVNLTRLDLSGWNPERIVYMASMFGYCEKLSELDLSGWKTERIIDMTCAFEHCISLRTLHLPDGFITEKTRECRELFNNCHQLERINTTGWNTSNVESMRMMFCSCGMLEELDVSGFNTANVTDMSFMFNDCVYLMELDVSGFDTSRVESMENMFANCQNLIELDMSGWDMSSVKNRDCMFDGCAYQPDGML